jgi:hypothetical protein
VVALVVVSSGVSAFQQARGHLTNGDAVRGDLQRLLATDAYANPFARRVVRVPFRAFGIRPSRMNPNICTICEMMFERTMKARTVLLDATILFADLRAYTKLSQSMSPIEMRGLLDAFYDQCASAIWHYDGLLNKTIGDAVMAVFNFPIRRADHPRQALLAAREMQRTFEPYQVEHRQEAWRARASGLVSTQVRSASVNSAIHIGT